MLRCSRCRAVGYCGEQCQRKHWNLLGHKQQCGCVTTAGAAPPVPPGRHDHVHRDGQQQLFDPPPPLLRGEAGTAAFATLNHALLRRIDGAGAESDPAVMRAYMVRRPRSGMRRLPRPGSSAVMAAEWWAHGTAAAAALPRGGGGGGGE